MRETILKSARLLMITDWLEFCVATYPMLTYTHHDYYSGPHFS